MAETEFREKISHGDSDSDTEGGNGRMMQLFERIPPQFNKSESVLPLILEL